MRVSFKRRLPRGHPGGMGARLLPETEGTGTRAVCPSRATPKVRAWDEDVGHRRPEVDEWTPPPGHQGAAGRACHGWGARVRVGSGTERPACGGTEPDGGWAPTPTEGRGRLRHDLEAAARRASGPGPDWRLGVPPRP